MSWLVMKAEDEHAVSSLLDAHLDSNAGDLAYCCTRDQNGLIHLFEAAGRNWHFGFDQVERQRISKNREVWFCVLEEHTMTSDCCFWRDGSEIWGVTHDSETGDVFHIEERGQLPEVYQRFKDRRLREQQEEDKKGSGIDCMISLPMDLCSHFTSYDGDVSGPNGLYFELYSTSEPSPPKVGCLLSLLMNSLALGSHLTDRLRGGRRKKQEEG